MLRINYPPFSKQFVRLVSLLLVVVFIVAMGGLPVPTVRVGAAAVVNTEAWTPLGTVGALAHHGNTIYAGGNFVEVGPPTGSFAAVNLDTGLPDMAFPAPDGMITVIIPDGAGGWFVGGNFKMIDGLARRNIAHIRADKTLDPNWDANITGSVSALAIVGNKLYVGGEFTKIDEQDRMNFAILDGTNGNLLPTTLNTDGSVNHLITKDNTLYIGGNFNNIDGQARYDLAALNVITDTITSWNPGTNGAVSQIFLYGGTVYIGGYFTTIGGQSRTNLAAIDLDSAAVLNWNPAPNLGVSGFEVNNGTLFVGGASTEIAGASRRYLAAFDIGTGTLRNWNSSLQINRRVSALGVYGGRLYIGGSFTYINNQERRGLASFDISSGALTNWDVKIAFDYTMIGVLTLQLTNNTVYLGGMFQSVAVRESQGLAAFDATTGKPTTWRPQVGTWSVLSLLVHDNILYVGRLGRLEAYDRTTGALLGPRKDVTATNSHLGAGTYAMAIIGNTLYLGGCFDTIAGQARNNLAALDLATGELTSLSVNVTGCILSLAVKENTLFIGGVFTQAGGLERAGIAAINVNTGQVTSWNVTLTGSDLTVTALAVSENRIYVGRPRTSIVGIAPPTIAAYDIMTGAPLNWTPDAVFEGGVETIAVNGNTVYVGGYNDEPPYGAPIQKFAAYSATTGSATNWTSITDSEYTNLNYRSDMLVVGDTIYIGSSFTHINNQYRPGFAILRDTNPVPTSTPTATQSATPRPPRADTIGAYQNGTFYLRNSNTIGNADITATFGGAPSDLPVTGDWNGDGMDTVGVYRGATGFFYLSNTNVAPSVAYSVLFGNPGDSPFAGRWTPDMTHDGIGVYRNSNGILYQKKALTTGVDDYFAVFGNPNDVGIAGDWNGDGLDSIGVYRSSDAKWYLSNNSTPAGVTFGDVSVNWFIGSGVPFVGDWNGDGISTPGSLSSTGSFTLRSTLATSSTTTVFNFGPADSKPIAGKWTLPAQPPLYTVVRSGAASANPIPEGAGD
jgi:hypothetical protein